MQDLTPLCPGCGGALARWGEAPAFEPGDDRVFPLLRCARCASAVTGGDPPGVDAYASGTYADRPPRLAPAVRAWQRLTVGQPLRMLRRAGLRPGARVLDAGAGRGRHLAALRAAGLDAHGIDPAGRGAGVERRALEDHADADLDAVLLWHVLEHLDDPAAALARVHGWLRPGGLLLVGVPNLASLQAQIAGRGWLHLDLPRHRTHFTPLGLRLLLQRAGFEPRRPAHLVWEHNLASMWMALLAPLGVPPGLPFHVLKRTAPARPRELALLAAGLVLLPAAAALEALAAAARRGGTIACVALRR